MAGEDNKDEGRRAKGRHPVVVAIGASAGGIGSLQSLFGALPENTGAAYVVVMHLDPAHHSELSAVLTHRTTMPVVQVQERQPLEADHVYVIPPDRELQIENHDISTTAFTEPRGQRAPVDHLLRSMAERLGDGIAVILSGAGADGALGVRAVKEAGGIILAEDPAKAEYPAMPRAAIASGVVDFVLPAEEIGSRLVGLIASKLSPPFTEPSQAEEELLRRVLAHVRVRTGHDFSKYKRSTVLRRIARRMQVMRASDLGAYYEMLRENPDEAQALLGDLLISVTAFFRDPEAFEVLRKMVLPKLFEKANTAEPLRVWVSGCATGEEAYTIAMLLLEEAASHEMRPPLQVFGSDLDARALAVAREGRYPATIEEDVGEERLRRFFAPEGDGYRIRQEVRDIMLFALHDLLKDPPFSRVDLISCRNVLIYLDRDLKEQVCSTFHYALNPGGFLMLGAAESAEQPAGLFRAVDRNARIFQSTSRPGDKPRLLPRMFGPVRVREPGPPLVRGVSPVAALSDAAQHRRAIERVAPPSILVDENHRVVHISDSAGRFLQPAGGPLTSDVVDLVRAELRFELRSALHRAFEQQSPTLSLLVPMRFNGALRGVHLLVKPAEPEEAGGARTAIVMFIEGEVVEQKLAGADEKADSGMVRRLTQELELTQARLRTVREESEAANEELRAANEELQSINEEYRSTSEELETSKEELQSINEELQAVNNELKLKLEAISRAHSDLQNLMAATDVGTLFLDSNLRIKRFTQRVTELFSVTPADEGRPITDFAHQLEYSDLVTDAREVLENLAPLRREVRSRGGRWYDMALRPYRTVDNKIDGVVVTFVDVSERRKVEQALRESERLLRQQKTLIDLSRDSIFVWDFDAGIVEWNRGSEELYGYSRAEALGRRGHELLATAVPGSSFEAVKQALLRDGSWAGELLQKSKDGRQLTVESRIQLEAMDGKRLVLESARDITERKLWEGRRARLVRELTYRMKSTLAAVQSIANQTVRGSASADEFIERFGGRLRALATAYGLLVEADWTGADLGEMVRRQFEAYWADKAERVRIEGAPFALPADLAMPVGLVLHELASNAAKHGALARSGGSVSVRWRLTVAGETRNLNLVWEEAGVADAPAGQAGFGTLLIDRAIPNGKVTRSFGPNGLCCTIEVPLGAAAPDSAA